MRQESKRTKRYRIAKLIADDLSLLSKAEQAGVNSTFNLIAQERSPGQVITTSQNVINIFERNADIVFTKKAVVPFEKLMLFAGRWYQVICGSCRSPGRSPKYYISFDTKVRGSIGTFCSYTWRVPLDISGTKTPNPVCKKCCKSAKYQMESCLEKIHLNRQQNIEGCPYDLEQLVEYQQIRKPTV